MYAEIVGFESVEAAKAGANYRKHGVRMPEATGVFDDPYAIAIADDANGTRNSYERSL